MLLTLIGIAVATLCLYAWRYLNKVNKYWEERGVPSVKPIPFFGNVWPMISRKRSFNDYHQDMYDQFPDAPFYGFYEYTKPILAVKDVDLVERVIIKDFQYFTDRYLADISENPNPLDINLMNMRGNKWRAMRHKLSPLFTTGRLRQMVPHMKEISDRLLNILENKTTEVDLRDSLERFSLDVIGSCAFGLDIDTVNEVEESEFRKMGKRSAKFDLKDLLRFFCMTIVPKLSRKLEISRFDSVVSKYFSGIVQETIAHRKETGMIRNDFVQLFVALQQKGSIEFVGDDNEDDYLKTNDVKSVRKLETYALTDDVMIGQAFNFLLAGFEAATISMLYICYDLAMNPDIQAKAREEVVKVTKTREGVLDYDALRDMTYYSQCVQESMRLHTFAAVLFRECTKDYTFPGTSLTIKAGQAILIPTGGIHMDPCHYEEPDKFNPDRFAPDVSRKNCTYLPFGDGPRVCIAMRFAMTEIKLCVARILMDFTISLNPKTKLPLEIDTAGFGIPKNTLLFDFKKATT